MKNYLKLGMMTMVVGFFTLSVSSCSKDGCMECGAFGVTQTYCEGEDYGGQTLTEQNIDDIIAATNGLCKKK